MLILAFFIKANNLMKIALAQINPIIGGLDLNFKKSASFIEEAKKSSANLIIFSELSLLGYPPKDLILKNGLIEKQNEILQELCKFSSEEFGIIVGGLSINKNYGKKFHNSIFCIRAGQVEMISHKMLLPNYDVFDETRYFQPADSVSVWDFMGYKFGLSICEDIWVEAYNTLYTRNPIEELAAQGAQIIINASASPYNLGKVETRNHLMSKLVEKYKLPLLYVNQVGANDQLIFDGSTKAYRQDGSQLVSMNAFQEEMKIIDSEDLFSKSSAGFAVQASSKEIFQELDKLSEEDLEEIYLAISLGIKDYVHKSGFSEIIIGLSGGIDSALVAVLAAEALGSDKVHAYMLASEYTSEESFDDARRLAKNLGINYKELSIKNLHSEIRTLLPDLSSLADENIQPRLRAVILMAEANSKNAILLATGNKSEIAVGYSTLYGDSCGALAPIGDLLKTQVYKLANFINKDREIIPQAIIQKDPSAELRPNQKDSDSLPDYEILDKIIMLYVQELRSLDQIVKEGFDEKLVKRILNMIDKAEYKRQQAPPILKIAGKAFGLGRRMPIVQGFSH
jgi:NAD+ synthase (glutamine-hydrolysing)